MPDSSSKLKLTMEVATMTLPFRFIGLLLTAGLLLISTPALNASSTPSMPAAAPQLISPASGALMDNGCSPKHDGITWDFDWSDVPGATAYHLRVWHNPALPLINNVGIATSDFHYVSAPSDYIANTNLGGWHWMVRAKVRGVWGPWSSQRFFRVEKLNTDCP
jgi:hypothetical protein